MTMDMRRVRMLFGNDIELSVVQLFKDIHENELPYEAYVISGPTDVLDSIQDTYPWKYPVADVMRYDSYGLADLIKSMQEVCGGLSQVYFRPGDQKDSFYSGVENV